MEKGYSGNVKKKSSGNKHKKTFSHLVKWGFPSRPLQLHPGFAPGVVYHDTPENGFILYQHSYNELVAQNAALRDQLAFQRNRHEHERQRLLKALKKPNSDVLITAVNDKWQQWWAIREQQIAAQLQTEWHGMHWYINEMNANFCSHMESLYEQNAEIVGYLQSQMDNMQWYTERAIAEKNDLIKNLRKENAVLKAQNKEMTFQLCKFKAETPEHQKPKDSLDVPEQQLQTEKEAGADWD
ncbi:uncharacterized protein LOC130909047 [Corythoichthys intestinalis]|uniref:uncharacterized protein LOC130909047 n=1 Tax=Corythoichthys intestinalis TaxID=161448 RepID=UPI0025A60064|nr:uncharacterized protein LOC130909047 [Corythoichthys intestinalis]